MDLLTAIVTSKARRKLLELLWADNVTASVKEFSELASLGFATTHRELAHLAKVGLATKARQGNALRFSANLAHEQAALMRSLVTTETSAATPLGRRELLESLAALGAPLDAHPRNHQASKEFVLASAVALSRTDSIVARVLPYVLHKQRHDLRLPLFKHWSRHLGVSQASGMFLDLAGTLGESPKLKRSAGSFHDARRRTTHDFFVAATSAAARALAEQNTSNVSKRWHFRMNMPLSSMQAVFHKQAKADALLSK